VINVTNRGNKTRQLLENIEELEEQAEVSKSTS